MSAIQRQRARLHNAGRIASRRACFERLESRHLLAFGLTTTTSTFTVDTGANVVFSVLRAGTSSTIHSGDLTSFKYSGVEYAAPYASPGPTRYSHFESGLSSLCVVSATVDPQGNWIKIACDDTTATVGAGGTGVIQYYVAKKGENTIYMATYAPELLTSSTRFITYLNWSKFPNHPDQSDTSAIHGTAQTTIESGDVFMDPVDGRTHSKYYAENRLIGHVYHGATGPGAGAFMFIGNRESGSGGPFWKDIDFQSTGAAVEMYNIPYSDHSQSEPFRPGLAGPYAIVLTNGSAPSYTPDYTFLDNVGITGLVPTSGRGTLTGKATGIPAGHVPTVALSNTTAQYWGTPDASGNYTIPGIKPGTYTETLYDEEIAVATRTVTITAGQTTAANITNTNTYLMLNSSSVQVSTPVIAAPIFRIGNWDGTPREFLNGDQITDMHPSDPRLDPWADSTGVTNFIVGTTPDNQWPMAEWKYQTTSGTRFTDTTNRITFNLTAAQAATPLTLRIGITRLDHGRPAVSINGTGLTIPGLSTQPTARGLTLGSWRGNNTLYAYTISTSQLHAGTNTIDITCASGSGSGGQWLSPWHIYDAIDLVPTSSLTNAPVVTTITVTPNTPVLVGATQTFTATARDQFGNVIPANFTWTTTRGTIDDTGAYIAPATTGSAMVTATSGARSGSVTFNVTYLKGDLNLDGQLNIADLSQLLRALTDLPGYQASKNLTPSDLLTIADINGDGAVTNVDIQPFLGLLNSGGGQSALAESAPAADSAATSPSVRAADVVADLSAELATKSLISNSVAVVLSDNSLTEPVTSAMTANVQARDKVGGRTSRVDDMLLGKSISPNRIALADRDEFFLELMRRKKFVFSRDADAMPVETALDFALSKGDFHRADFLVENIRHG